MLKIFSSDSANNVWKAAFTALTKEEKPQLESRLGLATEIRPAILQIQNPLNRWVVARVPELNPAFALAEVIWILAGRDDTAFLEHWFSRYAKFVGGSGTQHAAYGARLRRHFRLDQLGRAYEALRSKETSRQVVLQIWSAYDDLPNTDGTPRAGDIPCNICSCLKVRNRQLHWLQVMRSNDVDRGLPHNIIQFTMLQEILAGWLDLEVGDYTHIADSLHFYTTDRESRIDDIVEPIVSQNRFKLGFADTAMQLQILVNWLDELRVGSVSREQMIDKVDGVSGAFDDIRLVLVADHLRKLKEFERASSVMARCTNPAYVQCWDRWLNRLQHASEG